MQQKNIKRRRYRLNVLYSLYVELFRKTAEHYRFPYTPFPFFNATETPIMEVALCCGFQLWGGFSGDNKYDFTLYMDGSVLCGFTLIQIRDQELVCKFKNLAEIRMYHFVMLKMITAIFFRQRQKTLSIHHQLGLKPLLYEAGLLPFDRRKESAAALARREGKAFFQYLSPVLDVRDKTSITLIDKSNIEPLMFQRLVRICDEVIFKYEGQIMPD